MEGRSLLISDLDGTLLGDDGALSEFATWIRRACPALSLAYASGRLCPSIAASIQQTLLPEPVAIIGGVGTEIEYWPSRRREAAWEALTSAGWCAETVRRLAGSFPRLEPQDEAFQSPRKVSYFVDDAHPEFLAEITRALEKASISADIIYSSGRDLDIVPRGANKGTAGAFVAQKLGFENTQVLVAGDSGNDLNMFKQHYLGIVPRNAHPELRQLDGARVYHSPLSHAAGVLDGLRHWLKIRDQ